MSSSSRRLLVSWQTGSGRTERLWTLLRDPGGALLSNISLQTTATSVLLDRLQPGTAYSVAVVTEAAGLQSSASVQAVTGESVSSAACPWPDQLTRLLSWFVSLTFLMASSVPAAVSRLRLDNNGSSRGLLASWLSAEGGVGSYLLTLSARGAPTRLLRLTPNITQV